ncbi:MAG: D-alanyl-D-alanine carboxypeptidase/D-alanyl-D-alanine-endopeptidase [Balneola sp.]
MRKSKYVVFLFLTVLIASETEAQGVEQLIQTLPNQEAFWSVTVVDDNGNKLENYNSDKLIIPASNQKLYTLATVLDRLGSDFRYTTNIYGDGELVDSIWIGNLIIKGSGDPSISGFLYEGDRYFVFKSFLEHLKAKGIKKYAGNISKNLDYFDGQVHPVGWDWYDLTFYYGVEIAALSFNNNAIDIEVFAEGLVGEKPTVKYFPNHYPVKLSDTIFDEIDIISIDNQQIIIEENKKYDEKYLRKLGSNEIYLGSKLPQGYKEEESLSISDAGNFFTETFEVFLRRNGIISEDSSLLDIQYSSVLDSYPVLASHTSKPLSELVKWANKESDNFYTEMMLKTMAAEKQGVPGTFENGIKEVRDFLAEQGVDTNLVKMNDGSGLAMGNYTTSGNISKLLYSMKSHHEWDVFYDSFPVAGIDGSIAHRFKGTELYNNVRAKTGYVSGVRTLSGYMTTGSGREIIFSIATNHFAGKVSPVDNSHQQILQYLYEKY